MDLHGIAAIAPLLADTDKGLPSRAAGLSVAEFLATSPQLNEFWTPLVVLYNDALNHNAQVMADWCKEHGFSLMPHGKTTMAPVLWQLQLDAGAHGITLATAGQVRTGRSLGLTSIMMANALTDPQGLQHIAGELDDPNFTFSCWADSVETIEAMERGLDGGTLARPLNVLVELGAAGGRTGARSIAVARKVAERVVASPSLRLAGVAGYEGSLGHDRSDASLSAVRAYLESLVELHSGLADLYDDAEVLLTVGGSAYFDLVAEVVSPTIGSVPHTRYVLRSGASLTHDEGFYQGISPLDAQQNLDPSRTLVPAMRGLARIVSHPEPGLALFDAGKRDFPFDEGLPKPISIAASTSATNSASSAGSIVPTAAPAKGMSVSALNDQHGYLRLEDGVDAPIGSVVTLGLSHPCTAFDKWRYLPVVASANDSTVVNLIRTYF
jgi:D-serine deaminase-like pyridoxal phosphate-dependent protein